MSLLERAQHLDVNLGAVEGTITMVVGPWLAKVVKSSLEGFFGLVPLFLSSETVLWARRKLQLVLEAKETVDVLKEVKRLLNLAGELLLGAENVSIVLLEATNSDQTIEGARDLVSVEHTKVGVPERQVTIAVNVVCKHGAVSGTIHGLKTEASIL